MQQISARVSVYLTQVLIKQVSLFTSRTSADDKIFASMLMMIAGECEPGIIALLLVYA